VHMHFNNSKLANQMESIWVMHESDYLLGGTIDTFIDTHMTGIAQDKRYIRYNGTYLTKRY